MVVNLEDFLYKRNNGNRMSKENKEIRDETTNTCNFNGPKWMPKTNETSFYHFINTLMSWAEMLLPKDPNI